MLLASQAMLNQSTTKLYLQLNLGSIPTLQVCLLSYLRPFAAHYSKMYLRCTFYSKYQHIVKGCSTSRLHLICRIIHNFFDIKNFQHEEKAQYNFTHTENFCT